MTRVLLISWCMLLAFPSLAPAGTLRVRGQTLAFAIFSAPSAQMTWYEADGITKLANGYVSGANPVYTSADGKFTFNLTTTTGIFRTGTYIQGHAVYGGGLFYLLGNSAPMNIFAGPSQNTIISGIVVNIH